MISFPKRLLYVPLAGQQGSSRIIVIITITRNTELIIVILRRVLSPWIPPGPLPKPPTRRRRCGHYEPSSRSCPRLSRAKYSLNPSTATTTAATPSTNPSSLSGGSDSGLNSRPISPAMIQCGITDEELVSLSVRDLNRQLKMRGLNREEIVTMKQR
ncbi:Putative Transcription factor MafG [Caligus rogercresseyi]|uniref:Transcription factor MafG n=1 Tax=Caligus rogercresseyi TaxID=217165 RepID=A0A7T8GMW2_CALRO|nr:Putative Transcription factor MafG [Caligus rogercresseyi]